MSAMQLEFQERGRVWTDRVDELVSLCELLARQQVGFRVAPSTKGWVVSRL